MIQNIPYIKNVNKNNFFLLAGPCVVENEEVVFEIAEKIIKISDELEIPFIFK